MLRVVVGLVLVLASVSRAEPFYPHALVSASFGYSEATASDDFKVYLKKLKSLSQESRDIVVTRMGYRDTRNLSTKNWESFQKALSLIEKFRGILAFCESPNHQGTKEMAALVDAYLRELAVSLVAKDEVDAQVLYLYQMALQTAMKHQEKVFISTQDVLSPRFRETFIAMGDLARSLKADLSEPQRMKTLRPLIKGDLPTLYSYDTNNYANTVLTWKPNVETRFSPIVEQMNRTIEATNREGEKSCNPHKN